MPTFGANSHYSRVFGAQPELRLGDVIDTWGLPRTDAWRLKFWLADPVHGGWNLEAPPDEDLSSITDYDLEIRAKIERKKSRSTILREIKGMQATRGFHFDDPSGYHYNMMSSTPGNRDEQACS